MFLVGPSGAGKSTLIKLLVCGEEATAGTLEVAGHDLGTIKRGEIPLLRRQIGIVFQDFRLLPRKTVRENVAFALEVTGAPRKQIRATVDRLLGLVGLTGQADQRPGQLSGGEMQRAAIARAMVHGPAAGHRRRADRQPRPAHQLGDHPAAAAHQRDGHHGAHGDPQRRGRDRAAQARRGARGRPHRARRGRWLPPATTPDGPPRDVLRPAGAWRVSGATA